MAVAVAGTVTATLSGRLLVVEVIFALVFPDD
jgi:hypothetical protein